MNFSFKTEKQKNQDSKRGKHPASLANLKKWKRGESGNPGGRPRKYKRLKESLLQYVNKKDIKHIWDDDSNQYKTIENDLTYQEEVLEIIWKQAKRGSLKHIELLADLGCLEKK